MIRPRFVCLTPAFKAWIEGDIIDVDFHGNFLFRFWNPYTNEEDMQWVPPHRVVIPEIPPELHRPKDIVEPIPEEERYVGTVRPES
jgi:hypothetical protein